MGAAVALFLERTGGQDLPTSDCANGGLLRITPSTATIATLGPRSRAARVRVPTCKLPCHHVVLLAKRDPVSVEQVNLLRIEGEADHFSDAHAAWPP